VSAPIAVRGPILVLDTATSVAVIALGDANGRLRTVRAWSAGHRHGEEVLFRIEALLSDADLVPGDLGAIVVGIGPGAFTGLRVGLATAKTLAHALDIPIVGVSTGGALLAAAAASGATPALALLLPAGPSDRVLVEGGATARDGRAAPPTARLVPGGAALGLASSTVILAVDLEGRAEPEALALGELARAGLAASLLEAGAARLARGEADDAARLVPEYVTLPRGAPPGAARAEGEVAWSRDRR